jgi:hypothetical protein
MLGEPTAAGIVVPRARMCRQAHISLVGALTAMFNA